MEEGALDQAPIWSDVKTFETRPFVGLVDIIIAGYPCQPMSLAGKGLVEKDPRWLWPEVRRIVDECEPPLVFCENVSAHWNRGFQGVVRDMEERGYEVAACFATAWAVGAPHIRERLFWLALRGKLPAGLSPDAIGDGLRYLAERREGSARPTESGHALSGDSSAQRSSGSMPADASRLGCREPVRGRHGAEDPAVAGDRVADADCGGREELWLAQHDGLEGAYGDEPVRRDSDGVVNAGQAGGHTEVEPEFRRVDDGLPGWVDAAPEPTTEEKFMRVDRLRMLGNAVVPRVAAMAFAELLEEVTR
jgi:DNA (cytosine-5)-methyltransferase 1